MKVEDWLYEAVAQRAGEILEEMGYDEDLHDDGEKMLLLLDDEARNIVRPMLDRMECSQFDDQVTIYRGAFRDGLRYGFSVMTNQEISSELESTLLNNIFSKHEKSCSEKQPE